MNKWPTEHLDVLRNMAGSTAGEMLRAIRKLRPDATRNAVSGQCARHGIALSSTTAAPKNRVKAGTRERVVQMRAQAEQAPLVRSDAWKPLPGVESIPLMERSDTQCPWPIGDEPPHLMKCCGAPKPYEVEYCSAHMRLRRAPYTPPFLNLNRLVSA